MVKVGEGEKTRKYGEIYKLLLKTGRYAIYVIGWTPLDQRIKR